MKPTVDARVRESFFAKFGGAPTLVVRAPGRVNLIGEHTDYNDGFVFPCAIGFETRVAARARADKRIRIVAADFGGAEDEFDASPTIEKSSDQPWSNYIRGVVDELRREQVSIMGADLAIAGDIPQGAGLSSSASLETAAALALLALAGREDFNRTAVAQLCQRAENDFVGCQCGIMDQLVSARGESGAALLIDCRSLAVRSVKAPASLSILIAHSGVVHGHASGAYNDRRRQCEEASAALGVKKLRDADQAVLCQFEKSLDATLFQRAHHVITENQRTLDFASAFAKSDLTTLGRLMRASHASLRDDFEISTADVDRLADLFNEAIGEDGGARMTGGGFGGAVVAITHEACVPRLVERIERAYRRPDGRPTEVWTVRPAAGAALCPV
ncbi:MAG: galactokinase [Parvularculaceae bacterium]|nr:galactokinase [Parvularculaceae bacterium]